MDHFDEIFNNLSNKLRRECILSETSQHFSTLNTDFDRFKVCYNLLEEANLLPDFQKNSRKNASKSAKFRNEGNCAFFKRNDMVALQYYSKSINFAPEGSEELALGFANRSAVSFSLNKFSDCIIDIDRAFACNYPEHLQYKLYERKGKSLLKLGKIQLAEDSYRIALESVKKSKLSEEKLNNFKNALERELQDLKVEDISNIDNNISNTSSDFPNGLSNNFENSSDGFNSIPKLSFPQNKEIPAACDAIRIEYSDEMGRHVVATKDISPGDVLVVEQPYVSVLLPSAYYLYCFNCLKRCHTLLPCPRCTKALYCCESCRENNWRTSHSIECNILEYLTDFCCTKLELLALRMLIISSKIDKLNELKDYIEKIEIKHQSIIDNHLKGFNDNNEYISSDYCTTYYLATNTELRTVADLFRRSCIASIIIHCVDKLTNYFDINKCDINDDINNYFNMKCFAGGLLLKYLQIMPCNAHEVSEMCLNKTADNVVNENTDNNGFIYDSVEIGGALYPILSLINHSCDPNVVRHSHNGDTVVLTAIQHINKGDQIFDNYGYHHAVHDCNVRQNHLLSQYHFICLCIACTEDWPRYHFLPHKRIVYKVPEMQKEVEESSKEFRKLLQNVLRGEFTSDVLNKLTKHLSLLQAAVKRPWKEYSECQEAIKQTLSMHANHYVHCTSTKTEISQ